MGNFSKIFTVFMLTAFFFAISATTGQAAEPQQEDMTVKLDIYPESFFWEYPYLTKQGYIAKPTAIKIVWDWGNAGESKPQTIATIGQKTGKQVITTPKNELVNIKVLVCDAKNNTLGSISFMVRNKGQAETVRISPPEFTEPVMSVGNN